VAAPYGLSLSRRCELLGVSRSGFYAWCHRSSSRRAAENAQLALEIRRVHMAVDRTYGSPRMHRELVANGWPCGRHRVARLMRVHGVRAKQARRFLATTDSTHGLPIARNLVARQFTAARPNELWMTDVTYIATAAGWAFLAVVLDAFSRRVVGWALDRQLDTRLVQAALTQALTTRQPPAGLVHHSDQGSPYASLPYRTTLAAAGIRCSMSRRGDCYDNAVVESFFHSLKVERVHHRRYASITEAHADLHHYIEGFYNRIRRHSTLGYISPVVFEMQHVA
jgi:transposase InsO family protein